MLATRLKCWSLTTCASINSRPKDINQIPDQTQRVDETWAKRESTDCPKNSCRASGMNVGFHYGIGHTGMSCCGISRMCSTEFGMGVFALDARVAFCAIGTGVTGAATDETFIVARGDLA